MNNRQRGFGSSSVPKLVLVVLLLCCTSMGGWAAPTIDGSFTVWGYSREDTIKHTQVLPVLSLTLRDFGIKALRFETTLRGYSDVREMKARDRQMSILRGVLIYAPEKSPWEVRVGQQWLTEGVGRDNVAGLWGQYKFNRRTSLIAYGGAQLSNAFSVERKNNDLAGVAGVHLRTRVQHVNLGASYYYLAKRGTLLYSAAGVDAWGRVAPRLLMRGRLYMNAQEGSIERGQVLGEWMARENVQVTGELRIQSPRVYENSFFHILVGDAATAYARAGARWDFYKRLYIKGTGITILSGYPNALYKVQAAVGCRYLEAGYTHWLSVSKGVMDGVYAQANYGIWDKYNLFAGYDFARGANAPTDERPLKDAESAYFGASATPISALTISARGEQIRDLQYKQNWRVLASVTARFSNLK
jgi:hypothetical protein